MTPELAVAADADAPVPSLTRQIYATVRERIIRGQYGQGTRLPEARMGEELHVSRVPLREAVPLLERDGFVRSFPRRGAVVTSWSERAVDDLFDARLSLEVRAAGYAARRVARGGDLAVLTDALAHARSVLGSRDAYAIAQSSTMFHEAVVRACGNELMVQLMSAISGRIMWLFYLTSGLPVQDAFDEHVELRDAIASGNERVAEAVAYAHIERDRAPTFAAMHPYVTRDG